MPVSALKNEFVAVIGLEIPDTIDIIADIAWRYFREVVNRGTVSVAAADLRVCCGWIKTDT